MEPCAPAVRTVDKPIVPTFNALDTKCSAHTVPINAADSIMITVTIFPASFRLLADDALYICGTTDAVARYHEEFPE